MSVMSDRLKAIRARYDVDAVLEAGCDDTGWAIFIKEPDGTLFAALRATTPAPLAAVEGLADAPGDISFLLGLLGDSFAEIRRLKALLPVADQSAVSSADGKTRAHAKANAEKDYAANAAMIVDDERFRAFIAAHMDEPVGNAAYATLQLKRCVGITSRAELNTNEIAAARWRDLLRDYEAELRHGNVQEVV